MDSELLQGYRELSHSSHLRPEQQNLSCKADASSSQPDSISDSVPPTLLVSIPGSPGYLLIVFDALPPTLLSPYPPFVCLLGDSAGVPGAVSLQFSVGLTSYC